MADRREPALQDGGVPIDDEVRSRDIVATTVPVELLTLTLERVPGSEAPPAVEWEQTRVRIPARSR